MMTIELVERFDSSMLEPTGTIENAERWRTIGNVDCVVGEVDR